MNPFGCCPLRAAQEVMAVPQDAEEPVNVESEEESDGEPKDKITRLAIGIDSGFEAKKFDVLDNYSLVSFPHINAKCPIDEKLGADLYGTCQYVISATSAERIALLQNASNAWDGEIKQITKHANLVQVENRKKIPLTGWKCEAEGCSLSENLWLNLTDGAISYDEDDAVIDPNLEKHLAHFGIDARTLKKTEKSTLELELDMNQK
ncbi:hypothetical protein NECAME_00742 [Necator americanus]|uniref:Uncharacterized protein n=1 Tax=Necator americanus TaxID=51031 RepID=W2SV82_NECAM|nr:hypothetical protein NECAME_00742 [Necator americanus]ETN73654.1 hypothetical protein NECAME_00742 [Necator americanus]